MILLVSLLISLVSATSVYQQADLGIYHNEYMQANSRLIFNPFSIFGNPSCEYNGNRGACYGEVECLALAGNYGNFCPGLQGLCCLFYRTCGQRTSQDTAYFRNVQYPLEDRAPTDCPFKIVKRADEYCGLRVTMQEANLPARSGGSCQEASFFVTGIHNDRLKPKCGPLTGKQYTYDITHVNEVFIHIGSQRSSSISWNIRTEQVKCSEWVGEDIGEDEDHFGGGGGGTGGGGVGGGVGGVGVGGGGGGDEVGAVEVTTKPTPVFPPPMPGVTTYPSTFPPVVTIVTSTFPPVVTPVVGPPAPPTSRPTTTSTTTTTTSSPFVGPPGGGGSGGGAFERCGQRGPSFNQGTRGSIRLLAAEGPLGPDMSRTTARRRKTPLNRRRPPFIGDRVSTKNDRIPGAVRPADVRPADKQVDGSIGSGAVINSFEWGVPDLSETLFSHYAGKRSILSTRITYGQVAGAKEIPWQIAMTIRGKFHCGASLISNNHVLTAAHCVVSYKNTPSLIDLSLGDWDLSTTNDGHNLKAKVSRVSVHPSYSRSTLQNDLAVLKLTQPVKFTEKIRPICLPTSSLSLEGKRATVTGWGRNEAKKLQSQLHKLEATIISNSDCDSRWNKNGAARGFIVQSMMCMDSSGGDSCNGDSGGPSVYEYPVGSGDYIQVGIVSFGSGSCTDADLPGVYTRVSYYKTWIQQQMF